MVMIISQEKIPSYNQFIYLSTNTNMNTMYLTNQYKNTFLQSIYLFIH